MKKYVIGIDCRLSGLRHAGIGRYILELVSHLASSKAMNFVLFFSDKDQVKETFPKGIPDNCRIEIVPVKHYTIAEQVKLPAIFSAAKLDLLHVPHFNIPIFYTGKVVTTIHDLLWHEYKGSHVTTLPQWQYWLKYTFYRWITNIAVKRSKKIFVPSETVKKTLSRFYPSTTKKIVVTPEAVSASLQQLATKIRQKKRKSHQLLYVGSLYPHKNIQIILKALASELLNYQLIIAGSRSVFKMMIEQQVVDLDLVDRVTFKGDITDQELANLYVSSQALIQPSLSEGFGLTGLEAMTFSTPVIASKIPIFEEVYQDGALYFSPKSTKSFAEQVQKLEKISEHDHRSIAAKRVSKRYSWQKLAESTYRTYLSLLQ